jgi:hypothetical protein
VWRVVRARLELVLAAVSAVLAVVTSFWPTWIELFLVSPDAESGETEWWLVAVFAVAAVAAGVLARRDLRAQGTGRRRGRRGRRPMTARLSCSLSQKTEGGVGHVPSGRARP